jgi:hypothetical protein
MAALREAAHHVRAKKSDAWLAVGVAVVLLSIAAPSRAKEQPPTYGKAHGATSGEHAGARKPPAAENAQPTLGTGQVTAPGDRPGIIENCGDPFSNNFGPFDYRTAPKQKRDVVERNHFPPQVESLRAGKTGTVASDIEYTLRAFPNHPRALTALIRLGKRDKTSRPRGSSMSVGCYVERAVAFRPDDIAVRQVRGVYLAMQGRHEEAIKDFDQVLEHDPNNTGAHYNRGLSHFEMKDYDAAAADAKLARQLGLDLPGLENKLKLVGRSID